MLLRTLMSVSGAALLAASAGCSSSLKVRGTYPEVYTLVKDSLLADRQVWEGGQEMPSFALANGQYHRVGERFEDGVIDFIYYEPIVQYYQVARMLTVTIEPHGDDIEQVRTVTLDSWNKGWGSMLTLWTVPEDFPDIEKRADRVVRAAATARGMMHDRAAPPRPTP